MDKHFIAAAVTVTAIFISLTAPAHAEFRIGMEIKHVKTTAGGATIHAGKINRGGTVAPFVQYRHTLAGGMQIGWQAGFGAGAADFRSEDQFSDTLNAMFQYRDGRMAPVTVTFDKRVTKSKVGDTFDAAVLFAFPGARITPIAMLGWTSAKIETTVTQMGKFTIPEGERNHNRIESAKSGTFTGWEISAGAEFRFDEVWAGHALLHYADASGAFDIEQTGFRAGITFRF